MSTLGTHGEDGHAGRDAGGDPGGDRNARASFALRYRSRRVRLSGDADRDDRGDIGGEDGMRMVATQEVTVVAMAAVALEAMRPTVGMEVVRASASEASRAAVHCAREYSRTAAAWLQRMGRAAAMAWHAFQRAEELQCAPLRVRELR